MRAATRLLAGLALVVGLGGCATGELMRQVEPGMAKEEVVALLGQPDGYTQRGDYEALQYTNRLISGWAYDRTDYTVILRDGRVVEYGPGEVRQRDANVGALVLVPTQ